jgi:hypothetical protein
MVVSGGCAYADGHAEFAEGLNEGDAQKLQGNLTSGNGAGLCAAMSRLYVLDLATMQWFLAPVHDDGPRDCVGIKHVLVPLGAQGAAEDAFLMVRFLSFSSFLSLVVEMWCVVLCDVGVI